MKKALLIILISISLTPTVLLADSYTLIEPLPCIEGVGDCTPGTLTSKMDLNTYLLYIYKFSIGIAVFLAIVRIIWGGFLYITSATPFGKQDGREKITEAVIGLCMILASYLILRTIDPRLVNIDASIPKIKYDQKKLDTARNFQNELASELIGANTENQLKIKEVNDKILLLKQEKAELDKKIANGEFIEEYLEEAKVKSAMLSSEINNTEVGKRVIIAENNGSVGYAKALENIYTIDDKIGPDLAQYTAKQLPNPTGTTLRPTNSPNPIQNSYNQQINELLKKNIGSEEIPKLEKQRDYYISQVIEDLELKDKLDKNGTVTSVGSQARGIKIDNTVYIKNKLSEYQSNINNESKIAASGLSPSEYNKIMKTRIDTINKKMGNK